MRSRTFLLVTTALSSATLIAACKKESGPPGNPKGSHYANDAASLPLPGNPKGSRYDDGQNTPTPPVADASPVAPPLTKDGGPPIIQRMPANPKGSHYDAGKKLPSSQ